MTFTKLSRWTAMIALLMGAALWLAGGLGSNSMVLAQEGCSVSFALDPSVGTADPGGQAQFNILAQSNALCPILLFVPVFAPTENFSMAFNPPSGSISPGGQGLSQGTVSVAATTPAGPYELNIQVILTTVDSQPVGAQTLIYTLHVTGSPGPSGFDFSLMATPALQTVNVGGSADYTVAVTLVSGMPQPVQLSLSGLPPGAQAAASSNPVSPGQTSVITIATSSATPPGTYPLVISGTAGGTTRSTRVALVVQASFDFSLSASPTLRQVNAGQATTYEIAVTLLSGQAQPVALTVTGLPRDARANFSSSAVIPTPGGAASTLTIETGTTTPAGVYEMTITGTSLGGIEAGGPVVRTTRITLVVQQSKQKSQIICQATLKPDSIGTVDVPPSATIGISVAISPPHAANYQLKITDPQNASQIFQFKTDAQGQDKQTLKRSGPPGDWNIVVSWAGDEDHEGASNTCRFSIQLAIIFGNKFNDLNGNGAWDLQQKDPEPGISDWEITITGPEGVQTTKTRDNGGFQFTVIRPASGADTYIISEKLRGWVQTYPNCSNKPATDCTVTRIVGPADTAGPALEPVYFGNEKVVPLTLTIDAQQEEAPYTDTVVGYWNRGTPYVYRRAGKFILTLVTNKKPDTFEFTIMGPPAFGKKFDYIRCDTVALQASCIHGEESENYSIKFIKFANDKSPQFEVTWKGGVNGDNTLEVRIGKYKIASAKVQIKEPAEEAHAELQPLYVIFNPWGDRGSDDYNVTGLADAQLENPKRFGYVLGDFDNVYYSEAGGDIDTGKKRDGKRVYKGAPARHFLLPTNRDVFTKAIEWIDPLDITSAREAIYVVTEKTSAHDFVPGNWHDPENNNFKTGAQVPNVVQEVNMHNNLCGQCLTFASLTAAFSRSLGVPDRIVTDIPEDGFFYHAWNEVWLNEVTMNQWSAHDATPGLVTDPTNRQDQKFKDRFKETPQGIKPRAFTTTQDGVRDEVTKDYPQPLPDLPAIPATVSANTVVSDNITLSPFKAEFQFGEDVVVTVTFKNPQPTDLMTTLNFMLRISSIGNMFLRGDTIAYSATEGVTIPGGGEVRRTYTIPQAAYVLNGLFVARASMIAGKEEQENETSVDVIGGFELDISGPSSFAPGQTASLTIVAKNLLERRISNIQVRVHVLTYMQPDATNFLINLEPDEQASLTVKVIPIDELNEVIEAQAFSTDAGLALASYQLGMAPIFFFQAALEKDKFSKIDIPQEILQKVFSPGIRLEERPNKMDKSGRQSSSLAEIGLQMNPSTGTIVGTPTATGEFWIWIEVLDADAKHIADIWVTLSVK